MADVFSETGLLYQQRCIAALRQILSSTPDPLHQAMHYSVLVGGKRLRPLLVYAAGECADASMALLDNAAVAVELIHAYSLIHDDLPAMDNADLRHGQAACHKKFGEATAILAGDALQSLAFECLAQNDDVRQIRVLAQAIGAQGMALGQSLDMQAEKKIIALDDLKKIHLHKTGALIAVSVQLGLLCGKADKKLFNQLTMFAEYLGLAFQIQDDILDIESTAEKLGKNFGQDKAGQKATYPQLLGMDIAKRFAAEAFLSARNCLARVDNSQLLLEILRFVEKRVY